MVRVVDMPADRTVMLTVASWVMEEWRHMFPDDTVDWYLDVWSQASRPHSGAPHAVIAVDGEDIVGTASVVVDDELPDAEEPGPWLALTWVRPDRRRRGIGTAMVRDLMRRCPDGLWLYTESESAWYESMGWQRVRESSVNGVAVTVMSWRSRASQARSFPAEPT